jgi:hypothetical protein
VSVADDARHGLVAGGQGGPEDEMLEDGQEEVFAREELETGKIEHHAGENPDAGAADGTNRTGDINADPAELNRGVGQERVGEDGPGRDQRPLDPAAGGPGTGAGSSANPSPEDTRARTIGR